MRGRAIKPVRVGIVGAGWWARETHAPAFLAAGATIEGVCSRSAESAGALASTLGTRPLDFEQLLGEVDAIAISTPDDTHAGYAVAAACTGVHVFVEKPLGRNVEEAEAILEATRAARVVGMTGLTARGDPITDRAWTLVADGSIGKVLYVRGSFDIELFVDPAAPATWRTRREVAGPSGVIADLGAHLFDLAEYVTGLEIDEVTAKGGIHFQRDSPVTNLDEVAVLAGIGGASALFSASRSHLGSSVLRLEVQGSRGALLLDWGVWKPGKGLFHASRPGRYKPVSVGAVPAEGPYQYGRSQFAELARRFVEAVRDGSQPAPSIEDGVRVQRVIDAVWRSVEDGSTPVAVV
jgi:predicted dehydrogenase